MTKKFCLFLCVILALSVLMTACGNGDNPVNETENPAQQEQSIPLVTAPEDEPYIEPPTAPPVQLRMPDYELSYCGDMADIISWEELEDAVGLQFYIAIGQEKLPLFSMHLNENQGDVVQMVTDSAGQSIPVSFQMEEIPEGISQEDERTFCMAQDLVNDIMQSLIIK